MDVRAAPGLLRVIAESCALYAQLSTEQADGHPLSAMSEAADDCGVAVRTHHATRSFTGVAAPRAPAKSAVVAGLRRSIAIANGRIAGAKAVIAHLGNGPVASKRRVQQQNVIRLWEARLAKYDAALASHHARRKSDTQASPG